MSINIHIEKKDLWLLTAIGIFLVVGVAYVIAYNSGASPSVMWHSGEELEVEIGGNTYTLQEAITNNLLGGGGSSLDLTNCAWTGWGTCTASLTSNLICPIGQVVRGYQREGCTSSSPACDDPTRCEHVQLYCCG